METLSHAVEQNPALLAPLQQPADQFAEALEHALANADTLLLETTPETSETQETQETQEPAQAALSSALALGYQLRKQGTQEL